MATRRTRKPEQVKRQVKAPAAVTDPKGPKIIGKVRRGQVASLFGAGAVIDLRAPGSGAPLSGLVAGLEEWDRAAPAGQTGLLHQQRTSEPRLQRRLNVSGFRFPPVKDDADTSWSDVLPVIRFPQWLLCPHCERLGRPDAFAQDPGKAERWCGTCSAGGSKVFAVPVRFIVACEEGHLDEFPWQRWVNCHCEKPALSLETLGAGLAGKWVVCKRPGCVGKRRSLEGAFSRGALLTCGIKKCAGHRAWLPLPAESCTQEPRVLQRGASTVYYPVVQSALDIPPFSLDLSRIVGNYWQIFEGKDPSQWEQILDLLSLDKLSGIPREVLLASLHQWKLASDGDASDAPLEWAEYLKLREAEQGRVDAGEFQAQPEPVPPELGAYLGSVVLARRLREVRAQMGFTRIKPPTTSFKAQTGRMGQLSGTALAWLPAIELRGEGIFLRFNMETLQQWETSAPVMQRAAQLTARRTTRDDDAEEEKRKTSPRFLLLHSFAHALMRQLSLTCGYSNAALRERLYVGFGARDMAGVLVHTGSADSEGTLGGLVRQGREQRLETASREMFSAIAWCSSDPLCITGAVTLSSPDNLAACHACLLAPETSCQHFNLLLDRAMLIGTPDNPALGYFHQLLLETT